MKRQYILSRMHLVLILLVSFSFVHSLFFPSIGGGGDCCCQQSCCMQSAPPSCGCCGSYTGCGSGCGGGCGKRKKREVGHVRGYIEGQDKDGLLNGQCNSGEISELIKKHLYTTSTSAVRSAIYQELDALYPEESFTVFCVDGTVSYQADSQKYCIEGNAAHNCYVFQV